MAVLVTLPCVHGVEGFPGRAGGQVRDGLEPQVERVPSHSPDPPPWLETAPGPWILRFGFVRKCLQQDLGTSRRLSGHLQRKRQRRLGLGRDRPHPPSEFFPQVPASP